ncbi:MAG TPA: hypothetical protein VL335_02330 [Candidatus Paceibacterota bacterium]|nr:hypothetical protein [Candidatus Paceibacterota bacterium]
MIKTGVVATRVWSVSDLEVRQNSNTDGPASSHVVVCMFGLEKDVFVGTKKECEDFVTSEQEESLRAHEKMSAQAIL